MIHLFNLSFRHREKINRHNSRNRELISSIIISLPSLLAWLIEQVKSVILFYHHYLLKADVIPLWMNVFRKILTKFIESKSDKPAHTHTVR